MTWWLWLAILLSVAEYFGQRWQINNLRERVAHLEGHLCGAEDPDDDDPDEEELDPPETSEVEPDQRPDVRLLN